MRSRLTYSCLRRSVAEASCRHARLGKTSQAVGQILSFWAKWTQTGSRKTSVSYRRENQSSRGRSAPLHSEPLRRTPSAVDRRMAQIRFGFRNAFD